MPGVIRYLATSPGGGDPLYVVGIINQAIYIRHGANDYLARRSDLDAIYAARFAVQRVPSISDLTDPD